MPPLYALYVTNERRAARDLAEMNFDVWRPTYQRLNRAGTALEPAALLATYVLARIPDQRFHEALSVNHVAYAIMRPIPETIIAELRADVDSGRFDERMPATKARPRSRRAKGLASLRALLEGDEIPHLAEAA